MCLMKFDRGRVLAEAVIIEVRQRSCVKFGRDRVKASVMEVKLLSLYLVWACCEVLCGVYYIRLE